MKGTLLHSLLKLAHATSQNLAFAHRPGVHVSYGEETITETNLLELRRRHPSIIRLEAFSKAKESSIGADWEWHIIGRARRFGMRVQAKRIQKNDTLKIPHIVGKTKNQQIDLLLADAKRSRLRPVYCIYSAEKHRAKWSRAHPEASLHEYEYGCLLVDAGQVKNVMPKSLVDIEKFCVPWHYIADRRQYAKMTLSRMSRHSSQFVQFERDEAVGEFEESHDDIAAAFPTIDELNRPRKDTPYGEGVFDRESSDGWARLSEDEYRERGINRVVEIDVRQFD